MHPLAPLAKLYGKIARWHGAYRAKRAYFASIPVISVGNITVGGTGKTTLVEALAHHYATSGHRVAIVSRGYGGSEKKPLLVHPHLHSAREVGDEPYALATALSALPVQVWVGRHRPSVVRRAEAAGNTLIILDDGFQRRDVARDVNILTIDSKKGFGNGLCLPAGPLREPLEEALPRAHFAVSMSEAEVSKQKDWNGLLTYRLHLTTPLPAPLKNKPLVAFTGLARPSKFFDALKASGAKLKATKAYPDHHVYTQKDLGRLQALAKKHKATLVTTPKDAPKLPRSFATILPPKLQGEDWEDILAKTEEILATPPQTA
ncbi:MAG: tetraacyldisaccharide 4'-kinase [Alphaproteobacteria bacterium CG_4_10_14_0_8_um_filter_53_9]|nr:MAG: tetraacyldisaccharide 4'-kinase [Alphaproteobacteria bacterium CG_4_10_14_0_8_um_filter_53_9]